MRVSRKLNQDNMQTNMDAKANAAFKKEQRAIEASAAWNEYQADKAHVDANMMRLRALRLAKEAAPVIVTPAPKRRKKKAA
jgi:hypothetical protein